MDFVDILCQIVNGCSFIILKETDLYSQVVNAGSKCKLLPWAVQVESSDLIAYGLIPEFIGRFPVLVSLAALNEDQLVQVLVRFTSVKPFFAFFILGIV